MELFCDLAFTIALSFLLPLIFIKLLSVTPNFEAKNEKVDVIGRDLDNGVKSDSQNCRETEEDVRILGKIDEFRDTPTLGKIIVPEIVDNKICKEIELVDFAKDSVEDDCGPKSGCAVDESNQGINTNEEEIHESGRNEEVDENRVMLLDEDDWEGIERTELEKRFGAAVLFVESKSNVNLSNDVKMKLHGYHKIATQGPCQEPQPMALKFSARAKWNAWRQLGVMSPELAMERYISLLSESIPDRMEDYSCDNSKSASAERDPCICKANLMNLKA